VAAVSDLWHERYRELGTDPVPVDSYVSESEWQLEKERIFKRVWLNVGRVEELPRVGDYLVKDLPTCDTSLLIVRTEDGRVQAFHNVCSHRCNKLVWNAGAGSGRGFVCKFHGWTYGLAGKLRYVPDEERYFGLDKKGLGLTPVATDVWAGFIFVNLAKKPEETLEEYLGDLGRELGQYPFAETSGHYFQWTTEMRANWKVFKDGFQEVYHVPFLHRRSLPDSFSSPSNPMSHCLEMKLFPRHHRMSLYGNPDHKPTRVESVAFRYGAIVIRNAYESTPLPPGVNPTKSLSWSLDINVFFPNFFVDVADGTYFTYNIWPLGVDRMIWEVRSYFPKPQTPGQRFSQEYSKMVFRDALLEDAQTVEATQSVIASGAKTHFQLHDEELLIRHDHQVRQEHVRRG
jgi:phenylpropionate dioxygenase-like ring-hydroxylating dioxygenase large terminal subunit